MDNNTETLLTLQADSREPTANVKIAEMLVKVQAVKYATSELEEKIFDFLDANPELDHAALMLSTLKSARAVLNGNAQGTGSMNETFDAIANIDTVIALAEGRE
jgi:hypothetical protein